MILVDTCPNLILVAMFYAAEVRISAEMLCVAPEKQIYYNVNFIFLPGTLNNWSNFLGLP